MTEKCLRTLFMECTRIQIIRKYLELYMEHEALKKERDTFRELYEHSQDSLKREIMSAVNNH